MACRWTAAYTYKLCDIMLAGASNEMLLLHSSVALKAPVCISTRSTCLNALLVLGQLLGQYNASQGHLNDLVPCRVAWHREAFPELTMRMEGVYRRVG